MEYELLAVIKRSLIHFYDLPEDAVEIVTDSDLEFYVDDKVVRVNIIVDVA